MSILYGRLLLLLTVIAVAAGRAHGDTPVREIVPQQVPTPPSYLAGTIILKLQPAADNRRDHVTFGLARLDAILERIGAVERRPLFPMAPWSVSLPAAAAGSGGQVETFDRVYVIRYTGPNDAAAVAREIAETGLVEFAEPYYIFDLSYTPNDPRRGEQYWLRLLEAEKAWDVTRGDSSITIGIIDTGLDWLHEDLADNIRYNDGEMGTDGQGKDRRSNGIDDDGNGYVDDYVGWDFIGEPTLNELQSGSFRPDNNPAPRLVSVPGYGGYHGTIVGGCASATADNSRGVAGIGFGARLVPIKCAADSIITGSVLAGYDAIRYAADRGCDIINCSWGANVPAGGMAGVQAVVDYARSKGALVIAASGNGGTNNDVIPQAPADLRGVLSVGATDGLDSVAGFTQYGVGVDVYAPGVNTLSTYPGNGYQSQNVSGTSFSAPITAGVAALVKSVHPDWTPEQIAMQLRVTGDRVKVANPAFGPYFYRRVNAWRAVSINSDLSGGGPSLPGIALESYTINGRTRDTIRAVDQEAIVVLRLRNHLAPATNIRISSFGSQALTLSADATIASIGTGEEQTVELRVRMNEQSPILYSEGNVQLILQLSNGNYEDVVAVPVPVWLPGWHKLADPVEDLGTSLLIGSSISAAKHNIAWATANAQLGGGQQRSFFTRTLNGRDWTNPSPVLQGTDPIYAIFALDAQRAWVGSGPSSGQAAVYRTTNGGSAWTPTSVSAITPFVNAVHFFDATNGIVIGDPRSGRWGIATTSDGGATWQALASPLSAGASEAGWNNSFAAVGDTLWFGTNSARIYRSVDRGRSWSYASTGVNRNALDLAFANGMEGVAVFRAANSTGSIGLMSTRDGGLTWSDMTYPFAGAEPGAVSFLPGTTRAMLSTQNGMYETSDFGASWSRVAMPMITSAGFDLSVGQTMEPGRRLSAAYGLNVYSQVMVLRDTTTIAAGVERGESSRAEGITLGESRPNPARDVVSIPFTLERSAPTVLEIYDARGLRVALRDLGLLGQGEHSVEIDLSRLPNGSYSYLLRVGDATVVRRMVVVD